jgi:hypothetical protein
VLARAPHVKGQLIDGRSICGRDLVEVCALLVAKDGVELENGLFFLRGELPSLDI